MWTVGSGAQRRAATLTAWRLSAWRSTQMNIVLGSSPHSTRPKVSVFESGLNIG